MRKATGHDNLHTFDSHGGPLGVECVCGRRGLISGEALGAHAGNMKTVHSLRFVCRECGSRAWTGYIFHRTDDALGWARGGGS